MKNLHLRGFTLVEIIVVTAILALVLVGTTKLMLETTLSSFVTGEKLEINADIRQFTLEMADNARASNSFFLYRSFLSSDRSGPANRLRDGGSGDFLLLVFHEPWPTMGSEDYFTRVVGYYREADPSDPTSEGPVRRFEKNYHDPSLTVVPPWSSGPYVKANDPDHPVESLISDLNFSADHPAVVQLSLGLANGQLFYNNRDLSIIVKAQIIHGNVAKRITDTYNYTVSPRG